MTMVGGLDVHRQQITFDYVDDDGLVHWGQIRPASRKTLRGWLGEHSGWGRGVRAGGLRRVALCQARSWRPPGVGVHLGDPAETAALRGPKSGPRPIAPMPGCCARCWWRAGSGVVDPAGARGGGAHPGPVVLRPDGGAAGLAAAYSRPVVPPGLSTDQGAAARAGREALARAELSAAGRQYVDIALRRIDELSAEIDPLRTQLISFARRQPGCRALQRHYGIGWLCAVIIWAEIGDARRFSSSDQVVRFAGWMSPSTPRMANAHRGTYPGRAHPGALGRIGQFSAAVVPGLPLYRRLAAKHDGHKASTRPLRWSANRPSPLLHATRPRVPHWRCPAPDTRRVAA